MPFQPGNRTINVLTADQPVTNSIVPVNIQNSASDFFGFALGAGKRIYWELQGLFTLGATGGFRFLAHNSSAPTKYNAQFSIFAVTAGTPFVTGQAAEAVFTNAAAVADTYAINANGFVLANAAATFSLQFAQNNATANPITLLTGMIFKLTQF